MPKKILSLTEGPITKSLLRFTFPFLLANLLQAMYGAVDLLVVGQFGDVSGVSAVATGSQIMNMITNVVVGLTMGGTVLIGQYIGAERPNDAAEATGSLVCVSLVIAVILTPLMLLFAPNLTRLMNAPAEAFDQTVDYVFICGTGIVFIIGYNAISGILRGLGDSKLPLLFVSIACVANIAGDLLFVAVFRMGAAGAALATMLSQAVSFILALIIVKKRGLPYAFHKSHIRFHRHKSARILRVGAPIALQDSLVSLSFLIIMAIINSMGLIVSAAVGVADRLTGFMMLVPGAFSSAIATMVAQNIGANKPERATRSLFIGIGCSLTLGVVGFLASQFFGPAMIAWFNTDPQVVEAGALYLKSFSIDCILVAFVFCFNGFFSGCGRTLFTMAHSLTATFLFRIPLAYFISRLPGVSTFEIGFAAPAASVVSAVLCIIYYRKGSWRKHMQVDPPKAAEGVE